MIQLDIICGLLGAGKTTLIRQLLQTTYKNKRIAIVENEAGKVNLDVEAFDRDALAVREVTSGCICCTVRGGFQEAIRYLKERENPDIIVVEPSGLADIRVVLDVCRSVPGVLLHQVIMVVNGRKVQALLRIAGDFFTDQIKYADSIFLNFADSLTEEKLQTAKEAIRRIRPDIQIVDVPVEAIKDDTFPATSGETDRKHSVQLKKTGIRIRGREEQRINLGRNWKEEENVSYMQFEYAFSEEKFQELVEKLKSCGDRLWRAKGCLRMEDGRIRKLDYVYGDLFQEEVQEFPEEKINQVVLISESNDIIMRRPIEE